MAQGTGTCAPLLAQVVVRVGSKSERKKEMAE